MLSTRRDLFPPELADELAKLQDKVAPFPGEQAQQLIEQALGLHDISDLFSDFQITPLASASIAQVHTARLRQPDGSLADVVIKVIRPGYPAANSGRFSPDGRYRRDGGQFFTRWQKTAATRSGGRIP